MRRDLLPIFLGVGAALSGGYMPPLPRYKVNPKVKCAREICEVIHNTGKDYCSTECCKLDREEMKQKRISNKRRKRNS